MESEIRNIVHQSQKIGATFFIQLMKFFRRVILQDAPFLMQSNPNCRLWNLSIFQNEEFSDWASRIKQMVALNGSLQTQDDDILKRALPALERKISSHDSRIYDAISQLRDKLDELQETQVRKSDEENSPLQGDNFLHIIFDLTS